MKHIWTVILTTVSLSSGAFAASNGTTSADFLRLGVGPRAIAMGEAQVGLVDDVYATYWNPAGLSQLRVQEAGFVQNQYVENISEQYAAYAFPHRKLGTFAGSVTYLGVGAFQGYDAAAQPTHPVGASDLCVGLSYARPLFQNNRSESSVAIGSTGKIIQERLDTLQRNAFAGDLGMVFVPGRRWGDFLDGWRAGLVLRNLGSSLSYDRESFPLPRTFEAGLSYTGHWRDEDVTFALDGKQPMSGATAFGSGIELTTLRYLILRAGYTSAGDLGNGMRFGGGLRFKTVQVDYAYAGAGEFGAIHRIGLTLRFGKMPENPEAAAQRLYENGMRDFKRRRYTGALVEFNKALEIDPSHPEALRMMKATYDEIKILAPE